MLEPDSSPDLNREYIGYRTDDGDREKSPLISRASAHSSYAFQSIQIASQTSILRLQVHTKVSIGTIRSHFPRSHSLSEIVGSLASFSVQWSTGTWAGCGRVWLLLIHLSGYCTSTSTKCNVLRDSNIYSTATWAQGHHDSHCGCVHARKCIRSRLFDYKFYQTNTVRYHCDRCKPKLEISMSKCIHPAETISL